VYINDTVNPFISRAASSVSPFIFSPFLKITTSLVKALFAASYNSISSPRLGVAGKVNVKSAVVSTKYLVFFTMVILVDTATGESPAAIVVDPPRDTAEPLIVIAEFASIAFVTVELGNITVPVNVGLARGALRARAFVIVDAYDESSLIAAANSFNVSKAAGAPSIRLPS